MGKTAAGLMSLTWSNSLRSGIQKRSGGGERRKGGLAAGPVRRTGPAAAVTSRAFAELHGLILQILQDPEQLLPEFRLGDPDQKLKEQLERLLVVQPLRPAEGGAAAVAQTVFLLIELTLGDQLPQPLPPGLQAVLLLIKLARLNQLVD